MKTVTSLPSGWAKLPSVTRPGKHFYRRAIGNITVVQSWADGRWHVYGQTITFSTAIACIMAIESPTPIL